ncbi:hypothetical protein [Inconstantimicrobium mannanitabidum]|uniref:Uncharacterized protein n=1 Tax=Inconstantimicrobium mannanitabidum TaxID=1604901 RepID=A0ACB5R9Q5_9CLOT|nr:hypothetical protein [Clostridium sp. TW13]GKX65924.1 hypothetical protein rsdtw13_11820 [Clostridium sp. TW13]
MKSALPESTKLYDSVFSDKQKSDIQKILDEINENIYNYSTKNLWKLDQTIGGIGGYCMPCDPIKNPFSGGEYRELFRPLQYARSEIDITGIHLHSKYIVLNCGLHLESVVRLALKQSKHFGNIRHMNSTLGNATKRLEEINTIPDFIIKNLFLFVKIYNKSKHEVNQDNSRERLFMADDAIIAYYAARIIGVKLLEFLEHDSVKFKYPIDNSTFNYS